MAANKIIQAYAKKLLTKNQGSGITTLPSQFMAESKAGEIAAILQQAGMPLQQLDNFIRSEKDLLKFLNIIEASSKPRVIPGSSAEGKAITEKLFGKKGEVIKGNFGKPFKEEIEAMKKSGDIVDVEDVKISEKITDRDMFKDANQRLKGPIKGKQDMGPFGKVDVETDYSSSINRPEFFDPKAKNMYGKTVKTGVEFIGKEKERILNLINNKKKNMVPPTHSNYKLLKKSLQDQEDALEAIKITEDLGGNENMFDFLRTQNIADYKAKPLQRSNYTKTDAEIKAEIEAGNKKGIESLKNKKDDPEGFYTGGMVDVEPNLSDIGHGSDALMARTRLVSPNSQATTSTGLNYLLAEDNDNIRVPFGDGKNFDMYLREREQIERQRKLEQLMKDYKDDMNRKKVMEQKQMAAEGGRIGFKVGGDAGRRAFLKLLATLGGATAAVKSGILGLGEGTTKKAVSETVKQAAGSGGQVPPYFLNLVKKIKTLGDDTLATQDKAIAKKYKDYTMEEDFAGNIEIIKKGDDVAEDVFMSYKVDEVPVKGKKGSTKVEEYEEFTARPDRDGKMKDIEPGVPDEVVQEGTVFEDTLSEFGKADGGRIGFSAGGGKFLLSKLGINSTSRRFLEKVFGKEKFATMIENDPEMHRGMLEVVEMFRKKDKKGLKMYMQKFLPHMDDATVEDFIIGSGGTEGIEGQLIRLGSGRDYKGKLDMIKEADQIRKLDDFDVEGVSKNAKGGRIGLFLGGGLTYGKGLLREMLKFMAKDGSHKKSPAEVLKMMNPKQFQKLLDDPRYMGKVSSEAPEGLDKIIQDMIGKTKTERSDMVGDIISTSRNIKKVDDDILKYKLKIIEDMVSKGIDREIAVEAAENISKEVAKSAGKKSTPKITEQGLLELENLQKNLLTKDRKLQAQGGLTTMLGE